MPKASPLVAETWAGVKTSDCSFVTSWAEEVTWSPWALLRDGNCVADWKYMWSVGWLVGWLVVANNDIVLHCIVFIHITPGFSGGERTVQDGGVRKASRREKEGYLLLLLPFFLSHWLVCEAWEAGRKVHTRAGGIASARWGAQQGGGGEVAKGTHRTLGNHLWFHVGDEAPWPYKVWSPLMHIAPLLPWWYP